MKRRAIGLPFAIFIMIILATLGIYSFYITSLTARSVLDKDLSHKMKLYTESAAELNILFLQGAQERTNEGSELEVTFENNRYRFIIKNTPIGTGVVLMDIVGGFYLDGKQKRRVTLRDVAKP